MIIQGMRRYAESIQREASIKVRAETLRLLELGQEAAAVELDRHCPHCQGLMLPNFVTIPAVEEIPERIILTWLPCRCPQSLVAARELEDTKRATQTQAELELYQSRLVSAGLVGWLGGATFKTFEPREDFAGAMDARARVTDYTNKLLAGEFNAGDKFRVTGERTLEEAITAWQQKQVRQNWLVLYGFYGTGKSHLAAAVVRAALDSGWRDIYFRVWPDYTERLRLAKFDENYEETELTIIRELRDGKLVVIDDLDKEKPSEWVRSVLYKALNHRYNMNLPTVLTFNYAPTEADCKAPGRLALEEFLGKAVIDRFIEVAYDTIDFNGPSYRSGLVK